MSSNQVNITGKETFGTVSVAMVTPFDTNGDLDRGATEALAVHLVDRGVDSLVLSGTTGESPTTTVAEKTELIKIVRSAVGDRAKIIAGTSTNCTRNSVELAKLNAEAGADALLAVTPYYSKPSQEGVFQHFISIANATDLPICLYDIPGRSSIEIATDTIRRLAEHQNIQGMKDAKGNLCAATELIQSTGLAWYSGDDPLNLPWLSLGATGFISVVGHAAPQALRELYTSFEEGDLARAREVNAKLFPLFQAQARLGGVSMSKAALRLQGIEVGDPRLPQVPATEAELAQLREDLIMAGAL
ncbi:4-hydroxy-tetrahydrodipicolinate synthase [Corynebacterium epidermidicanis]|uniref:4-hydroxy-tetrahydrodipicolinate synthase n=1 Tax=Corynebacterium epidermidicanis TaxID=1050174 RepID=A0A0G3GWY1_9CORY|nr:4-hydroxy-tetrahydrodipicolinate synthase [Corynebacterium epidermidicanis]AKK03362.1 dihydrodipicolinate synthase [Corynebacterium epidermidicanis]